MLTENLNEAKRISMRGELIDTCQTLKYMCAKLLSEMLEQGAHSEEDEDPSMQVYMLKQSYQNVSVYSEKYNEFATFTTLDHFNA